MPYRTPSGEHYHSVEGCCGAMEACPAGGSLDPCSKCHGRGEGVLVGGLGGVGGDGSYEMDLPGAYARKYANSVEGYPHGVFKTEDGIIRDRDGRKLSFAEVTALFDEAKRRRDIQWGKVHGRSNPSPEDIDYLGQLELEVQCFEAAYEDAMDLGYFDRIYSAEDVVPPIEPDTSAESFYEKRGTNGYIPKLVPLRDAYGNQIRISSTHLSDIVDESLIALGDTDAEASHRYCDEVDLDSEDILMRNRALYEMWRRTPPENRPQMWHLPPMVGASWVDPSGRVALAAYLGIDDPEQLERVGNAIYEYCVGDYDAITKSQKAGHPSDVAIAMEEYIALAPKWAGGTTYRGMAMTPEQVEEILRVAESNGEYHPALGATESWSTSYDCAKGRTDHPYSVSVGRTERVVFECPTQSRGTSVMHISLWSDREAEVLVSKDARHRIRRAERDSEGILHVYMEEIA